MTSLISGLISRVASGIAGNQLAKVLEGKPLKNAIFSANGTGLLAWATGAKISDLVTAGALSVGGTGVGNIANEGIYLKKIIGGTQILLGGIAATANYFAPQTIELAARVYTVGGLTLYLTSYGIKNAWKGNYEKAAAALLGSSIVGYATYLEMKKHNINGYINYFFGDHIP